MDRHDDPVNHFERAKGSGLKKLTGLIEIQLREK
jgi:hypothetical protein